MTSLDFFPDPPLVVGEVPEWGTLEEKSRKKPEDLWLPKRATWTFSGKPSNQKYTLTKLKLSDNRMTDQLLPRPQDANMSELMIRESFPAEHPYSSHVPKFAVFPTFAQVPGDPKRGIAARDNRPKDTEMPANPNDITIIKKIKGYGVRHELQGLPRESEKKPLMWHNDFFDQSLKYPNGNQQDYYPIPPKQYVPNLEPRDNGKCIRGQMATSDYHDNATRNVERDQWQTTYDRSHTGLGPANPNTIDNYDVKMKNKSTGIDDDSLTPRAVPTFDPAWPVEGRIARTRTPNPPPHTDQYPDPPKDKEYVRKMTLTELEEDRLLHGRDYHSYPTATDSDLLHNSERWQQLDGGRHAEVGLQTLTRAKSRQDEHTIPYLPTGPPDEPDLSHLIAMRQEQHDQHQHLEAQNRWKELELQTPGHNLAARQHKVDIASKKTQPKVFYDHEGKYQRERAGMYKTSYDPYKLQHTMNHEETAGARVMDYSEYNKNALDYPTDLNDDIAEATRHSRSLGGPPGSVPQLHSQPSQHEAFEPYNKQKQRQKSTIQPNVQHSDVRTQERGIILQETTHGDNYNTHKYLQENTLHPHARQEPMGLISSNNQDLHRVSNLDNTMQPHSSVDMPSLAVLRVDNTEKRDTGLHTQRAQSVDNPLSNLPVNVKPKRLPTRQNSFPNDATRVANRKDGGGGLMQKSRSTNFQPSDMRHSWSYQTSYQGHHTGDDPIDMSYKYDDRFNWKLGAGTPRPQTSLLKIQDSFNKSDVKKNFYARFGDNAPDLRENLVYGKKHSFGGMNAQIMRGTPIIEC